MAISITTKQLPDAIKRILKAGLVPFVTGSPGIAKSASVQQVAESFNLEFKDIRLAQSDPTELNGFPTIVENIAQYIPMNIFPITSTPLPEGKDGWLICLEELNSASLAVQAAAYKLILDRKVGEYDLHKNVAMVATGNLATDKAIVNRMGTAMQSRLVHLVVSIEPKDWLEWADKSEVDYRVKSYIGFRPDNLFKFDPNHNDLTFPCPRTWEFVSKIIKPETAISYELLPLITGCVGEGTGREFFEYCDIFPRLPTIASIKASPGLVPIPDEPSILYALAGLISHNITVGNIDSIMQYVNRLPKEFQVITIQSILRKDVALRTAQPIINWIKVNATMLM